MRRLLSVFLLGLLIAAPALAQSPVTECDRLAGLRYAPRVPGAPGAEYIPEPALAIAACEAESARSPDDAYLRLQLGRAYLAGDRTDPRVARLYASAIGALPALARLRLGTLYDHGWAGLKHDQHRALALYSEACAMVGLPGALVGCNNVALLLFDLGDAALFPRAMGMLESGCSAGDSYSCENFGYRPPCRPRPAARRRNLPAGLRRECATGLQQSGQRPEPGFRRTCRPARRRPPVPARLRHG